MHWYHHVLAVGGLAVACALWFLLQRFIARKAPDLPGIERRCDDCTCGRTAGEPPGEGCQRDRSAADARR